MRSRQFGELYHEAAAAASSGVDEDRLSGLKLRCLKKYGHDGVSVRRISAAAGVSIGLINHHFPSKSGLIAETYETLALSLQDELRARAHNRAASRAQRADPIRAARSQGRSSGTLARTW